MELLGIGFFELMLIFIIALIVLGPDEMVRVGALVGKFLRNIRRSDLWLGFQRMSRVIRSLPEDMAREAGIDELRREIQSNTPRRFDRPLDQDSDPSDLSAWTQIPDRIENNLTLPIAEPKNGEENDEADSES